MRCARDHAMRWSLALGADLDGSTTGIEAASNGAVLGIAERNREPLSFWQSTKYGLLVTAAPVTSRTHITARDQKNLLSSPVREGVADPPDVGQGLGGVRMVHAAIGVTCDASRSPTPFPNAETSAPTARRQLPGMGNRLHFQPVRKLAQLLDHGQGGQRADLAQLNRPIPNGDCRSVVISRAVPAGSDEVLEPHVQAVEVAVEFLWQGGGERYLRVMGPVPVRGFGCLVGITEVGLSARALPATGADGPDSRGTRTAVLPVVALPPPTVGLVHSGRGSEYASDELRCEISRLGLGQSMGRTGSCFDNAAESFSALLKEEIRTGRWPDRAGARAGIFAFVETFYNRRRLRRHPIWGYLTPLETGQRLEQEHALAA